MTSTTCTIHTLTEAAAIAPELAEWRAARAVYLECAEWLDLGIDHATQVRHEQLAHDALAEAAEAAGCCINCGAPTDGTAYCTLPAVPCPCQWSAACTNPATPTVAHPILGDVPTCARCEKRAR